MAQKYVFIVGMARTGSKLMMNVVANHSKQHFAFTNEMQFFGHRGLARYLLKRFGPEAWIARHGPLDSDDRLRLFVNQMYEGYFGGVYWQMLADGRIGVSRDEMFNALSTTDRTPKGIYEGLMRVCTEATSDTILGDKTGPNVYHVGKILKWFPDAKVIHTIRDPGAILASHHKRHVGRAEKKIREARQARRYVREARLRFQKSCLSILDVIYITAYWMYVNRLRKRYEKAYGGRYRVVRFEELVLTPRETVARVCEFLGVEFDENMLNPQKFDSSFEKDRTQDGVKEDRGTGFDESTLYRWESYLRPWMKVWLRICFASPKNPSIGPSS